MAASKQSLVRILSDVESANTSLDDQIKAEIELELSTAAHLGSAVETVSSVENILSPLEGVLAKLCSDFSKETSSRCRFERSWWVEKRLVLDLRQVLVESGLTAIGATEECVSLTDVVRQLWADKVALEGQVLGMHFARANAPLIVGFLTDYGEHRFVGRRLPSAEVKASDRSERASDAPRDCAESAVGKCHVARGFGEKSEFAVFSSLSER